MIKVGILSYWHVHAPGYTKEISEHSNMEITAVWDEIPERGQKWADDLNVPFYDSLDDILAADIDAVCVNTPTNMHEQVITKAAEAGKHIFTEKVLSITLEGAKSIAEAVEAAGVQFCISFPKRTEPMNLFVKQVIDSGNIGKVSMGRVRNAHGGSSQGWLPPHFYDITACGGGAMMDLGAHPMYLLNWFLGNPVKITSVFNALTGHGVEDNAISTIEFDSGAIGVSETGFVTPYSPYTVEVYGTEGGVMISGPNSDIWLKEKDDEEYRKVDESELPTPLPDALDQFESAITGTGDIVFGLKSAITLSAMMENAYKSQKEGKAIRF